MKEQDPIFRAEADIGAGKYQIALESLAKLTTPTSQSICLEAVCLFKLGLIDESISKLRIAISLDSTNADAFTWLSNILRTSGEFEESIAVSYALLEFAPNSPETYVNLGHCFLALNEIPKAVEAYQHARQLSPHLAGIAFNLGMAYFRQDDLLAAKVELENAIRLDPTLSRAYGTLAQIQTRLGQVQESSVTLHRAYRLNPASSRGLLYLAQSLYEVGRIDDAKAELSKAQKLVPVHPDVMPFLARIHRETGQMSEALETLKRAIQLDPKRVRSYFELAYVQKWSEESEWLVESLHSLLDRPQTLMDKGLIQYSLGKVFDDQGRFSQAIQHFDKANEAMASLLGEDAYSPSQTAHYIDSLIRDFDGQSPSGFEEIASDSCQPIFIVGMIRSGTTLVEKIISSFSNVSAGGELSYLPLYTRGILSESKQVDRELGLRVIDGYLRLIKELSKGRTHVTDKLPQNFYLVGLIQKLFPKAKIIHCKRDPVDTCLSVYVTPYNGPVRFAHVKKNIIDHYRNYSRLAAHWSKVIPGDAYLDVDYESLVACPEDEIARIRQFLGLESELDDPSLEGSHAIVRTPSNWQVRQPIYKSSVGRWRNYAKWLGEFSELQTKV
jgi:tetratricopeptide (TPR) repeat protein